MESTAYLETIRQHLKTAYLLNDDKIAAMLPVFITTLRTHVDNLAELAAGEDMQQLSRASHAVKGALLNIGLTELAEIAYTLEKQCRDGNPACDYQALIMQLQSTVSRFPQE